MEATLGGIEFIAEKKWYNTKYNDKNIIIATVDSLNYNIQE
jgi:hypothetical protein